MRRWARWGTLMLGVVLIGCGPQTDAPTTPIVGATATVGGVGTGTPGAAHTGTPAAGSSATVSAAPTLPAGATTSAATATTPALATGTVGASRSPAAAGTITTSVPITGTSVSVPIPPTSVAGTITATAVTTTTATAPPVIVAGDSRQVVVNFLASLQENPASMGGAVFFSHDLQSRLRSGTSLLGLMHLPSVYQSFTVTGPDPDFTAGTGVARAVLIYPDGPQIRDFRLRVESNAWVITTIASPDEGELTAAEMMATPFAGTALPVAPTPGGTETPPSLAPPTVEGEPTAPGPLPP